MDAEGQHTEIQLQVADPTVQVDAEGQYAEIQLRVADPTAQGQLSRLETAHRFVTTIDGVTGAIINVDPDPEVLVGLETTSDRADAVLAQLSAFEDATLAFSSQFPRQTEPRLAPPSPRWDSIDRSTTPPYSYLKASPNS
jgi:hypothetical protein